MSNETLHELLLRQKRLWLDTRAMVEEVLMNFDRLKEVHEEIDKTARQIQRQKTQEYRDVVEMEFRLDHSRDRHVTGRVTGCPACDEVVIPSVMPEPPCVCGGPPHVGECHFGWHKPGCPDGGLEQYQAEDR